MLPPSKCRLAAQPHAHGKPTAWTGSQAAQQLFYAAGNLYTYNLENVTDSNPFGSASSVRSSSPVGRLHPEPALLLAASVATQLQPQAAE